MTKLLTFEGFSDDTFGETTTFKDDYDNCASGKPIEYLVETDQHAIVVTGQFCPNHSGSWLIGVSNYDPDHEDCDFPDWNIYIEKQDYRNGFNPRLVIEAPDDVRIKCFQKKDDDE